MEQPVTIESRIEIAMSQEDVVITDVGHIIVSDSAYANPDWALAAIVYNFVDGRKNAYGYVWNHDGNWKAELPDNGMDHIRQMLALQKAMEQRTGIKWQKALLHIDRAEQDINIIFEYDDPQRWTVGPKDMDASVAALRPENK